MNDHICLSDKTMSLSEEDLTRKETKNEPLGSDDSRNDYYCWICHKEGEMICCDRCPRVYHLKCLATSDIETKEWCCPECEKLAKSDEEKSVLKNVSHEQFCLMLENALKRIKYPGTEPFHNDVDMNLFPDYLDYVFWPMNFKKMEDKIKSKLYVSCESILQDIKWIYHNCVVYNGYKSKLTAISKSIVKMLKYEINEIEGCTDCYLNSISKTNQDWFAEPCRTPHLLVYAKLSGFPYWPAKVLRVVDNELDVRFFGAHDRSFVSIQNCFWLSRELPANSRYHLFGRQLQCSLDELGKHIKKLFNLFGNFEFAPQKANIDLDNPHVFISQFKGVKCLQIMSERLRKHNQHQSPQQPAPSGSVRARAATTPNISFLGRTSTRKGRRSDIKNEVSAVEPMVEQQSALIDAKPSSSNKQVIENGETTNGLEQANSSSSTSTITAKRMSTRLRKHSEKYSNYSLETIGKRKTQPVPVNTVPASGKVKKLSINTPTLTPSLTNSLSGSFNLNESTTNSVCSVNEISSVSSLNSTEMHNDQRPARQNKTDQTLVESTIKNQQKRQNEDVDICKRKKTRSSISASESEIEPKLGENDPTLSKNQSSIELTSVLLDENESKQQVVNKIPKLTKSTPKKDKELANDNVPRHEENPKGQKSASPEPMPNQQQPIKIKISRSKEEKKLFTSQLNIESSPSTQNIASVTQTPPEPSVIQTKEKDTPVHSPVNSTQKIEKPSRAPEPTNQTTSLKINLGELVRNCKTKLGIESALQLDENNKKNIDNEEKTSQVTAPIVETLNEDFTFKVIETPKERVFVCEKVDQSELKIPDEIKQIVAQNGPSVIHDKHQTTNGENCHSISKPTNVHSNENNKIVQTDDKKCANACKFAIKVNKSNLISNDVEPKNLTNGAPSADSDAELKKLIEIKKRKYIEEIKFTYEQLFKEIKFNNDLRIKEILNESNLKLLKLQNEHEKKLREAKLKQWCVNCGKEAMYYCCWNTSYCDEECQKIHWSQHYKSCTRINSEPHNSTTATSSSSIIF